MHTIAMARGEAAPPSEKKVGFSEFGQSFRSMATRPECAKQIACDTPLVWA